MARVLIIDDQADLRSVASHLLKSAGHMTWTAEDGKLGEALFCELRPDLTIIDIWMPEQDGIQTLQRILVHDPGAKILVMSGQPRKSGMPVFDVASALGAADTIEKPFSAGGFLEKVNSVLVR